MTNYITCETTAAIVVHIREIAAGETPRYSGHSDVIKSLCGLRVSWDTQIPIRCATCKICKTREAR